MPFQAILREVDQLHNVSTRLEALAERHAPISEALMTSAGNVRNTATNWQWWLRPEVPSRFEYSRKFAQSKIRCTLERLLCPHQQRKACISSAEGRTQCRTAPKPTCCLTLFCISALLLHGGGRWALNCVYSGILATPHRLSGLSGQSSF